MGSSSYHSSHILLERLNCILICRRRRDLHWKASTKAEMTYVHGTLHFIQFDIEDPARHTEQGTYFPQASLSPKPFTTLDLSSSCLFLLISLPLPLQDPRSLLVISIILRPLPPILVICRSSLTIHSELRSGRHAKYIRSQRLSCTLLAT